MVAEQFALGTGSTLGREEVLATVRRWLHLPDLEALDVLMATAIAIYLPGDPLWLYYVGPPGATKTEPLRAFTGPRVHTLSTLTPNTLISGLKGSSNVDLLPQLDGKLLIIKDFTSILSKKPEDAAAIYADLRECYDGYLEKSFGSGVGTKSYHAKFGLIAAVTPEIDRHRSVHQLLGERFLRIDIRTDAEATIQRASELEGREEEMRAELAQVLSGCLHKAVEWVEADSVFVEQRFLEQLRALAHVAATLRSEVPRDRHRLVLYEPVPEVGTRLVKQLQKLGKALAIWRERLVVTPEDYVTVRRVALDGVRSQRRKVVGALQYADGAEMLTANIGTVTEMPSDTVKEICEDLWMLKVLERGGEQHAGYRWRLVDSFGNAMARAAVDLRPEGGG